MMTTRFLKAAALGCAVVFISACGSSNSPVAPSASTEASGAALTLSTASAPAKVEVAGKPDYAEAAKPGDMTIVEIVLQDDGEFDVLQAAVIRAGLVDALNGSTQYTVFAPTDQAFITTLGVADEAAALAAINGLPVDALTNILLFHVTEGRRHSKSVLSAPRYQMLNGMTLTRTQLAAAGLAATDISASNGIVHVINAVLLP